MRNVGATLLANNRKTLTEYVEPCVALKPMVKKKKRKGDPKLLLSDSHTRTTPPLGISYNRHLIKDWYARLAAKVRRNRDNITFVLAACQTLNSNAWSTRTFTFHTAPETPSVIPSLGSSLYQHEKAIKADQLIYAGVARYLGSLFHRQ